jgi:putative aminopeptidase FrvX
MTHDELTEYVVKHLALLVQIPSPAGRTEMAVQYLEQELDVLGVKHGRTRRGALIASVPGREAGMHRTLTAHVDTLGAMVKQVGGNGTLQFTQIGGYALNSIEGEYCTVVTSLGRHYRGTVLIEKPSVHVSDRVRETERKPENMRIRLDAEVKTAAETSALGIAVGDYVFLDPRLELTATGFVKSRHLDDKAGVVCLLGALKMLVEGKRQPRLTTHCYFSTSEEVGFGASSGVPEGTGELIAVDMGAVGLGQESDEYSVAICAKDSTGPFDYCLRERLAELCRQQRIPCKVDIYPYYGSDAAAALRAGNDVVTGLVGPGIDASHNLERTHRKALLATVRLILAYLQLSAVEVCAGVPGVGKPARSRAKRVRAARRG